MFGFQKKLNSQVHELDFCCKRGLVAGIPPLIAKI